MNLTLASLMTMVRRTVTNPREGAEEILSLGIPREASMIALALVVVLSILLSQLTNILIVARGGQLVESFLTNPVAMGLLQMALLVVMAIAIFIISRAMGGRGSFDEGLLLVVWLQFIMIVLQAIQTVSILIAPFLASVIALLGIGLFLWLLTHFIAVIHGFKSLPQVFVMIIVSSFALIFLASIVLAIFGFTMPIEVSQ